MTRLLSLFLLLGASTALAERGPSQDMTRAQPRSARNAIPLHRFLQRNAEDLGIDEETLEAIVAIAENSREEFTELKQELAEAKEGLGTLLDADEPNRRSVMAQVETLGRAEIAMRQAHLTTLMDIRALLTPEQRADIEQQMEERRQRRSAQRRRQGQRQGEVEGTLPRRGQRERRPRDESSE